MKNRFNAPLIAWVTLVFTIAQARGLAVVWRHSPLDRLGWLAFCLWLVAPAVSILRSEVASFGSNSFGLISGSVAAAVGGMVLELHALTHLAMALAVASVARPARWPWFWLGGAISWMPLLSWVAKDLPIPLLIALRLTLALATLIVVFSTPVSKIKTT